MKFQHKEPSLEEKRALKGATNVEALLYALDQRMTGRVRVVLVGRASYEIGNPQLTNQLRQRLQETTHVDDQTGRVLLTDDIDCYLTEEAQAIVDAGHPDSYVAKLAGCYVHALNERTLILPRGWEERLQAVPGQFEHLELQRLEVLDFVVCKGAAGRTKDIHFLQAFCEAMNLRQADVAGRIEQVLAQPSLQLRFDTLAQRNLRRLVGKVFPPSPPQIN